MRLSIIIPARNEEFLGRTIQDILQNIEGETEIIAVLDGYWPDSGIPDDDRLTLIHHKSIGQRAACNEAVRVSQAKYILKCDAHCAFDKGFDVKLMANMHDDWTVVPKMRNLHAFDWVCEEGHRRYQSPSGVCKVCGKETKKDIVWIAKTNPQCTSYCFDSQPHFQYFREYINRREYKEALKSNLTETMSLQGSCFMMSRHRYRKLNICDEAFGSWGSQGIEVACKSWLSGGKVLVNHNTWYAHMFRTQGGDFSFPYRQKQTEVDKAKLYAKDLFFNHKWDKAIKPLSYLIEKFAPVPGWDEKSISELKKNDYAIGNIQKN